MSMAFFVVFKNSSHSHTLHNVVLETDHRQDLSDARQDSFLIVQ